jgi:hypothetical protein
MKKSAKIAAIFLAVALLFSTSAYAARPVSASGTDYVPLREVCNTLGIGVGWDGATRTISLDDYGKTISLEYSGTDSLVNDSDGSSMAAKLVNDKTFVPKATLSQLLGATFEWNAATQSYEVTSWGSIPQTKSSIAITSAQVTGDNLVVKGTTAIDTAKSTYIQYYIGKDFSGTVPVCFACAGFNANKDGTFELSVPTANLKGYGDYEIVLEQNPASDTIIAPSHWQAFTKDDKGNVTTFGDITSMDEISNLALTVGMQTAGATFKYGTAAPANNAITITDTAVSADSVVITGKTTIDTVKSTYIQYYIGKEYDGTLSECVACSGFNAKSDGTFILTVPADSLRGSGDYTLVLEQNPASDKIVAPSHWVAFSKDASGTVTFGDITSMGEISNLAQIGRAHV